jgi:hypothetical protein
MSAGPVSAFLRGLGGARRWPRVWWRTWRILNLGCGHLGSVRRREPVDAAGREIPWFTYPAIEYLERLDFRHRSVFEFGAGNSTLYWGRRAARVVSIEHNRTWHDRLRPRLSAGQELVLAEDPAAYVRALEDRVEEFDVIVVDGIERQACCHAALTRLRRGGFVILDNADWHQRSAAVLREAGLIEVDFSGFGPVNGYTWTTSLFLHREYAPLYREGLQPAHGIGGLHQVEGGT